MLFCYAAAFHGLYRIRSAFSGRPHGQTIRERTTSLFDTLAPPYVWTHTFEEVREWYLAAGYRDVRETTVANDPEGFGEAHDLPCLL